MTMSKHIAVIGSGVSGLAAARELVRGGCKVTILEKDSHVGGHAWTKEVDGIPVDVGFMVFNRVTYPNMVTFFEDNGIDMEVSNMSFSVSLKGRGGVEWGSNGLGGLFAQKRNLLDPRFLYMIREMSVFHRDVLRYLDGFSASKLSPSACTETLGEFLKRHGYSSKFTDCYLVPCCGSIWSASADDVLSFSAFSVLSFLKNHHMLQLLGRPQWLTVAGRSKKYVEKVVADLEAAGSEIKTSCCVTGVTTLEGGRVRVTEASGAVSEYDGCVVAAHAPEALALLGEGATEEEKRILGAFKYSMSDIFLHRDANFMPERRAAWSAWNFIGEPQGKLCVTYWLNTLQNLGDTGGAPVLVTLNPGSRPRRVVSEWRTGHPIPSPEALAAAADFDNIQGKRGLWFCGAYQGYGFHEDGFKAGLEAAGHLLGQPAQLQPNPRHMALTWPELASRSVVSAFLGSHIQQGRLQLLETGGDIMSFGGLTGIGSTRKFQQAVVRVHRPDFYTKVVLRADLGLADAFVDGDFTCVGNLGLLSLLMLLIRNRDGQRVLGQARRKGRLVSGRGWWSPPLPTALLGSALMYGKHLLRGNTLTNARRNIANHYDLSNDLFSLFLDETMTYSCAIFQNPEESLKDAQLRKLHTIIDKARIASHHHVLEVGFGWGSLTIEMVKRTGCRVTGITLSREQMRFAQQRVKEAGIEDKVSFKYCDYRSLTTVGAYDRIVSCEMLEAVGHEYLGDFFAACDRLLARDGVAVVQVITTPEERYEEYRRSSDFIKEYIFPGCCVPSFAALVAAMEANSTLCVESVHNIGTHYATTLLRWRETFLARRSEILKLGFGEKFIRMWDYYFVYCAAGFQSCTLGDLQIVFSRMGNEATLGDPYHLLPRRAEWQ